QNHSERKEHPARKARGSRASVHRRRPRRPQADWVHHLGTAHRQRAQRHVSSPFVHGRRRAAQLRVTAADRRRGGGTGKAARADSRSICRVRGEGRRRFVGHPITWSYCSTGRRRAFSFCRFGGSVHSSRSPFSNSLRKNVSFMPPSMMSHGSTASADRSRKTKKSPSTPDSTRAARQLPPFFSAASMAGATRRSPSDNNAW